jgi:hypothetical protein
VRDARPPRRPPRAVEDDLNSGHGVGEPAPDTTHYGGSKSVLEAPVDDAKGDSGITRPRTRRRDTSSARSKPCGPRMDCSRSRAIHPLSRRAPPLLTRIVARDPLARDDSTGVGEPDTARSRWVPNAHAAVRCRRISLNAAAASAGDAGVGPMRLADTVGLVNDSPPPRPVEFGADAGRLGSRRASCPSKARESVVPEMTRRDEDWSCRRNTT